MAVSRTILEIETRPNGERYAFDGAEYDAMSDTLRLTYGPPTAALTEVTPEGHVVRTAAPDGYLAGLVLTDVRAHLRREGRVVVTLSPSQRGVLGVGDLAALVSHPAARGRHVAPRPALRAA